ncbi:hypothetical protein KDX38_01155 [Pseudomonas sp. CDFA 602]|uniref:hypothetical protein n=1 Tax=Pseudomonas californiensis TaxID=2829823 RepID=UPI001E5ECAA5|nr:hypothetical protein [Pseudomonas californiensis]MCD5992221.1 hypothetical protein [Pseudomonas californiensis]MCD5997829.1 hypothetical protein [Pseudomonas californiensis]
MSTLQRNLLVTLVLMGLGGYGVFHYTHTPERIVADTPTPHAPSALPVAAEQLAPAETLPRPQPLADCLGPDRLIDDAVIACRFGQRPQVAHDPDAQGMVSAQYLGQYQADRRTSAQRAVKQSAPDSAVVWQWDRKRTYVAAWTVTDNRIDGSSVCGNLRRGSIDYRECRKGAKVYFKEQCRTRSDSVARQRYCSAANGFSPLG